MAKEVIRVERKPRKVAVKVKPMRMMPTNTRKPAVRPPKASLRHVRESKTDWSEKWQENRRLRREMDEKASLQRVTREARTAYHQSLKKQKRTVVGRARKAKQTNRSSHTVKRTAYSSSSSTLKKSRPQSSRTVSKGKTSLRSSLRKTPTTRPSSATKKKEKKKERAPTLKRGAVKGLKLGDLRIKSLLGEGAFSKVYLSKLKDSAKVRSAISGDQDALLAKNIALKVIPAKREVKSMVWERHVLAKLSHPFVVDYLGSFTDGRFVCIMLEFAIGGEILYHFEQAKHGRFDWESTAKFYVAEIVCALAYVHSAGFVYRDLKPENVLLDSDGHVKLVDFGFAKQLRSDSDRAHTLCGSKEYVAPEVLEGKGYSFAVDCWSLGVLAFELTVGHLPFATQDCSPHEVLPVLKSTRVVFPPFVSSFAADLIRGLLVRDPHRRLGGNTSRAMASLKAHHCFQGIRWDLLESGRYEAPIKPSFEHACDASNYANARFDDEEDGRRNSFAAIDAQIDLHF